MTKAPAKRKLETAQMMHNAISKILNARSLKAAQSQYDRTVCISAVRAARDVFESVPIDGTAAEYGQAVAAALGELQDTYNDPDGEYTSGKGPIGDVYHDVSSLLDSRTPPETE